VRARQSPIRREICAARDTPQQGTPRAIDPRMPRPHNHASRSTRDTHTRGRVLIVGDNLLLARAWKRDLEDEHDVVATMWAADALQRLREGERFDLILCDLDMPGVRAIDLYDRVKAEHPECLDHLLFLTGGARTPREQEFLAQLGTAVLAKPVDVARVRALIEAQLGRPRSMHLRARERILGGNSGGDDE
jgi:CheY-like chemotaxis protein